MSARDRLADLLTVPLPPDDGAPWIDLVEGRPGSRGRVQDLWETGGGAGAYDRLLAAGDRFGGGIPGFAGGDLVRDFYDVARRLDLVGGDTVLDLACGPGTLTRHLADGVGPGGLVVGADLSPAMLTRAAKAVHRGEHRLRPRRRDVAAAARRRRRRRVLLAAACTWCPTSTPR